ncbi:hypothetical protein CJU90_3052 [Yarrowia sp. C11]|nr:hypothetical protein CKK34_4501 [Yarrowia sp. E02]KAG5369584.1 hypothetical protein CJU90_3052 [Yarrowia sp. C11]
MSLPLDIWLIVLQYTDLASTLTLGHVNTEFRTLLNSRDFEPKLQAKVQVVCPFIQPGEDGVEPETWNECGSVVLERIRLSQIAAESSREVSPSPGYAPLEQFTSTLHNPSDNEDEEEGNVIRRHLSFDVEDIDDFDEVDFLYDSESRLAVDDPLKNSHEQIMKQSGFLGKPDVSIYNNFSELVYQWQDNFFVLKWNENMSLDLDDYYAFDLEMEEDSEIWYTVLQLSKMTLIMKAYTDFTTPIGIERRHYYTLYRVDFEAKRLLELYSSFQVSSDLIGIFNITDYNGFLWVGLGTKVTFPLFLYYDENDKCQVFVCTKKVIRSPAYQYSAVETSTKRSLSNIPVTVPHRTCLSMPQRHRRYALVSFNPEYRCKLVIDLATGDRILCDELEEDFSFGISPAVVDGTLEFISST